MRVKLTSEQNIQVLNSRDIALIMQHNLLRETNSAAARSIRFVCISVVDHLIISETSYYSFTDTGLLLKLSKSQKYVLKYKKEEERIEKRGEKKGVEIGRKEGRQEKAIEMAKVLNKNRNVAHGNQYIDSPFSFAAPDRAPSSKPRSRINFFMIPLP